MFAFILSFLKSHWQTALIASAILSIMATIAFQRAEIHHLSNELTVCHAENSALENSNKALLASIHEQNTAIASLQLAADSKRKVAQRALARARAQGQASTIRAKKIETQQTSGDDCADMRKLLDDFVRR